MPRNTPGFTTANCRWHYLEPEDPVWCPSRGWGKVLDKDNEAVRIKFGDHVHTVTYAQLYDNGFRSWFAMVHKTQTRAELD